MVIRPEGEIIKQTREKIKAFLSSEKAQKRLDLYIERLFDTETEGVDEHVKKGFPEVVQEGSFPATGTSPADSSVVQVHRDPS